MFIDRLISPFKPADGPPPQSLLAFLRWCLSGTWRVLFAAAFFSGLVGGLEAATALILGWVVDSAVTGAAEDYFSGANLALLFGAVAFFLAVRPLTIAVAALLNQVLVGPNVMTQVMLRIHRWTLGQSVEFFDNDFAGRIAQKQMQLSNSTTHLVSEVINVLAFALASLAGSAVLLFAIDYRVTLAFFGWVGLYALLIRFFIPRVRQKAKARAAKRAMVTGQIVDTITNIKTVKLFALGGHEDQAAQKAMVDLRGVALQLGFLAASFRFCLMLVAGMLPVLLVGLTLYVWSLGQASAGEIVAAGAVAIRLAQMTGWVSFALMDIYAHVGEIEDGIKTLTVDMQLRDAADATALTVPRGEIALKDVSFAYGRQAGGVIGLNLVVKPGEKLGIVGASGAGKSTLVALLLRIYDPEEGHLEIDGQDLRDVTQDSLRQQIGMVTQETAMFNRTARDNILYGRPEADEAALYEAARKAEAHAFIADLQDHEGRQGYEAFLGERGVKLSGGQRQRIALARAILKDAPILVLDEATSALDSEVEAAIQTALERVMQGKTVLAIAHRLSTISQMDRIIVLDQGRIVEQGSHAELLRLGGLYARYWERQSGGFLGSDATEAAE